MLSKDSRATTRSSRARGNQSTRRRGARRHWGDTSAPPGFDIVGRIGALGRRGGGKHRHRQRVTTSTATRCTHDIKCVPFY